jgi:hypothetical protein
LRRKKSKKKDQSQSPSIPIKELRANEQSDQADKKIWATKVRKSNHQSERQLKGYMDNQFNRKQAPKQAPEEIKTHPDLLRRFGKK